jgi:hypothetical protein
MSNNPKLPKNLKVEWLLVTPAMAKAWLAEGSPVDRSLSTSAVETMRADMLADRWKVTHQAICFDEKGVRMDGQHRLTAVALSGHAQWFLIVRGIPRANMDVVDCGRLRTVADAAAVQGIDIPREQLTAAAAIANAMDKGCDWSNNGKQSRPSRLAFMERHQDAIKWTIAHRGSMRRASILGAFARAYYTADRKSLERALTLLNTGDAVTRPEQMLLKLKQWADEHLGAGAAMQQASYRRAASALATYLEGGYKERLLECVEEPFTIPE